MNNQFFKPSNELFFTKNELEDMKETYDEAVYTYYSTDDTIMPDLQFDELKEILEENGYDLSSEDEVEADNVRKKLTSENNMISLKKVQVFTDFFNDVHMRSVIDWLGQYDPSVNENTEVSVGWKLDGCASGLRWNMENGDLIDIVTRGNWSIFDKFKDVVNKQHKFSGVPETRCEMLMKKDTFIDMGYNDKYANPRNLVSGISNDININDKRKWDIQFIKVNDTLNANIMPSEFVLGYNTCTIRDLTNLYDVYKSNRSKLPFPTDGLVVYLKNVKTFEHIGKYPLHCIAIKFPPVEAITKVREIQWNLKKSGEWIPKALLEPIDLDGSTVKQTLVFNHGYIVANGIYPGAEIVIAKNGDIIPYIQRVITPGDETKANIPENTIIIGKHLYPKDSQDIIDRERFISGCYCLGIKNFGYSWFRGLATLCNNDIVTLFNPMVINESLLHNTFSGTKKPKAFMEGLNQVKQQVTIYRLLRYLQIPKLGPATAKQIARALSGLSYSTFSLEKTVVADCLTGQSSVRIAAAINDLTSIFNVNVEMVIEDSRVYSATFEMTGSPKGFGISSKDEFCKMIPNWEHTKLEKSTNYLITDDTTSTTGKMAKAKKLGTKVLTYSEAIELYANN